MRKLIVGTFLSLDGVMQAPGGPEEDRSGGFKYGGWSVPFWDDMMMETMAGFTSVPFAMLLGRKTYDIFAAHWPHASEEEGAPVFNNATKYVASRTRKRVEWQHSHLLKGSVPKAVAKLKQEDGPEIQVHGSGNLVQTLLKHDLVDEFRLWVFPVVLGKGKRLFAEGASPGGMTLAGTKRSTTGVLISTYRRAGEVRIGSFALDSAGS